MTNTTRKTASVTVDLIFLTECWRYKSYDTDHKFSSEKVSIISFNTVCEQGEEESLGEIQFHAQFNRMSSERADREMIFGGISNPIKIV